MKRGRIMVRLGLLLMVLSFQLFGFAINDINFDKSLQGGYKEFKIYNNTDTKMRYRVAVEPHGKEDISQYLEVVPKVITVEPRDYAALKIWGKAPETLEKKEYDFILKFKPLVIPKLPKGNGETIEGSSAVALIPKIGMKAYSGKVDYSKALKLKNISYRKQDKKLYVKMELENSSKSSIALVGNFYTDKKRMLTSKFIGRLGSESRAEVEIEIPGGGNGKDIKYIILRNDDLGDLVEFKL